jgi:hypothetical protein
MPTIEINNETLEYNNIIYVDAVNGDDTNGDGSEGNPYKTLQSGLNNTTQNNNETIYLKPGLYTIARLKDLFSYEYIDYIGEYNESIIEVQRCDGPTAVDIKNNFYNIIFKNSSNFSSNSSDNRAIFINANTNETTFGNLIYDFTFYNCVFNIDNQVTPQILVLDGTSSGGDVDNILKAEFINVSFKADLIPLTINANNINLYTLIDCSTNYTSFIDNTGANISNCLTDVTYDSDYNITSDGWENTGVGLNPDDTQANIGVYGGLYAWGEWSKILILLKSNSELFKYTNNRFIQTDDYLNDGMVDLSPLLSLDNLIKYNMNYNTDDNGGKIFKKEINKDLLKSIKQGKFSFNL